MFLDLDGFKAINDRLGHSAGDEFVIIAEPVEDATDALIRWERPDHGITTPASFTLVAEPSGLILDIDRIVVH